MKIMRHPLRSFDFAAAALGIALIVFTSIVAYGNSGNAELLLVESQTGSYRYSLSAPQTIDLHGPIGITTVEILEGHARVVSSPCREQICVNSGILDSPGDWTACLPNRIFLEISGNDDHEIDAFSY